MIVKSKARPVKMEKRSRVGIFLTPATRNRLNFFKAQLAMYQNCALSTDDALAYLLDKEGVEQYPELA